MIVAHLFLSDDRMTRRRVIALLIGFVGVLLLVETATHTHVEKPVKFLGSMSIIALCLAYEKSLFMQKLLRPVFHFILVPLRAYETALGAVGSFLKGLGRKILDAFRKPA